VPAAGNSRAWPNLYESLVLAEVRVPDVAPFVSYRTVVFQTAYRSSLEALLLIAKLDPEIAFPPEVRLQPPNV
jgi:hypothetical protein